MLVTYIYIQNSYEKHEYNSIMILINIVQQYTFSFIYKTSKYFSHFTFISFSIQKKSILSK